MEGRAALKAATEEMRDAAAFHNWLNIFKKKE
jgi:hypothetical protein